VFFSFTISIISITSSRLFSLVSASFLMSLLTSLNPLPSSPYLIASTAPLIDKALICTIESSIFLIKLLSLFIFDFIKFIASF